MDEPPRTLAKRPTSAKSSFRNVLTYLAFHMTPKFGYRLPGRSSRVTGSAVAVLGPPWLSWGRNRTGSQEVVDNRNTFDIERPLQLMQCSATFWIPKVRYHQSPAFLQISLIDFCFIIWRSQFRFAWLLSTGQVRSAYASSNKWFGDGSRSRLWSPNRTEWSN